MNSLILPTPHDRICATDRLRIEDDANCVAGWKSFAESTTLHRWEETDPINRVYGNAAVVAHYFDMDGRTIDMGGRDMYFFVKETGREWAVADQFSAYPG